MSIINEATVKVRRDTAGNWTSNNPTLNQGEWGYETDTGKIKIGDGSTVWTSLEYQPTKTEVDAKLTGSTDQLCKAWSNFDGTGTVAIRDDYNVSSITDNGTGDYTVNFTNEMSDTDYSVLLSITGNSNLMVYVSSANAISAPTLKTTSQVRVKTIIISTGNPLDHANIYVAIFGS